MDEKCAPLFQHTAPLHDAGLRGNIPDRMRLACPHIFLLLLISSTFLLGAQEPVTSVLPPGSTEASLVPAPTTQATSHGPVGLATATTSGRTDAPDETIKPTWETQSQARTYFLSIPAPRGMIVDRNGIPLAQTRISNNLALQFPTPLNWPESRVMSYARDHIRRAETLVGRRITLSDEFILKHYKNRGVLPMDLANDLSTEELLRFQARPAEGLTLRPIYVRMYPNGALAGHIIGYAGRAGRALDEVVQNNDPIFPDSQGREGIEQAFNAQLTGKSGQVNLAFDADGRKGSEKITIPPQPGQNVVLALDSKLQRLCEDVLSKNAKRGAIVIVDAKNGDVLAMASWPVFDPNQFVPSISPEVFKVLQDDPNVPLLPRAFRSAYPPGSTFKTFVGLAALETGTVTPESEFPCPPAFSVGNLVFRNWKKSDAGSLNFVGALTQSCNTWFYNVGIKTGGDQLSEWAMKCGLGSKTGLPLSSEAPGRIPTSPYMQKVYGRPLLKGDVANLSIGQGDTLISPLQMALSMAAVGNGGVVLKPRLVLQVQSFDNRVLIGYEPMARSYFAMKNSTRKAMRKALLGVVESGNGTAGKAAVPDVRVGGKTGTAQWGPKNKERTAAWFAGIAPVDEPKYAFSALYEGEVGNDDVHGGTQAAPLIGKVLREVYKEEKAKEKAAKEAAKAAKKKQKAEDAAAVAEEAESNPDRDGLLEEERQKEIERQAQDEN